MRTPLRAAPCQGSGLSLRRRGWDVLRRARELYDSDGLLPGSFAFPADASVPRILQNYTTIRKLFADAVGLRKVAPLPRRLPLRHQFFDVRVARPAVAPESQ